MQMNEGMRAGASCEEASGASSPKIKHSCAESFSQISDIILLATIKELTPHLQLESLVLLSETSVLL
jgi:hypothetical protein